MGHTRAIRGRSGPPPTRNLWGRNDCDNCPLPCLTAIKTIPGGHLGVASTLRFFGPEGAPPVVLNYDQGVGRYEFQGSKQ